MTSTTHFTYEGDSSEITFANNNKAFNDWKTKITALLTISEYTSNRVIKIKSVFPFGDIRYTPNGFVFATMGLFKNGKAVPACVFLRGDSVAVLVVLVDKMTKEKYILNVTQPRIAVGEDNHEECVAGMLDTSNNFIGVAAKEILEETGLNITDYGLEELCSKPIPMSQGACDEKIKYYTVEIPMNKKDILALEMKCTGNAEEGECIKLKVRHFDNFKKAIKTGEIHDGKSIIASYFYEKKIEDYENYVSTKKVKCDVPYSQLIIGIVVVVSTIVGLMSYLVK